jgi:hypothetical protein
MAVAAAGDVINRFFRTEESIGVLRLQTYARERLAGRVNLDTAAFVDALCDLFGGDT